MQIKDIFTPNIQYVETQSTLAEVARLMRDHDCGSIPVGEGDKLVGMVTDRDIVIRCIAEGKDPQTMKAEECMTPQVLYCYGDDDAEAVLESMGDQAVRRFPVVDRDKRLKGIVSLGDLASACSNKKCCGETMEDIREAA